MRRQLVALSTSVLVTITCFVLYFCLMLASSFDYDQCVLWAQDVAQSVLVQSLLSGPVIGLSVVLGKLFVSWLLLRAGVRRRLREQQRQLQSRTLQLDKQRQVAEEAAKAAEEQQRVVEVGCLFVSLFVWLSLIHI